ncbi:hypothetical protein BG006_001005, partial [Podila minutissima]
RIGLYKNDDYLGTHIGTRGLAKLSDKKVKISAEEKQKICDAWDWMKKKHPLIREVNMEEPSDLMNATESVQIEELESSARRNVNESGLRAFHIGPVDTGGPRTADESNKLENMVIGILGQDQQLVKYSNPCLLGYLFPTLYPKGRGFFSLDYGGIGDGQNQEIQYHEGNANIQQMEEAKYVEADQNGYVSQSDSDGDENNEHNESEELEVEGNGASKYSKHTLKSYAKFRLLSVDRRWGRNIKFILMMFDWIQKSAIFGYQLRIAPAMTAGRATRAHEVLERSNNDQGTKYRESRTVAIPPFIRTGVKYKQMLYQKFS